MGGVDTWCSNGTAGTTRFAAGDFHEWMFGNLNVEYMVPMETWTRELRIVKMEGADHPLEWQPCKVTEKGIELL